MPQTPDNRTAGNFSLRRKRIFVAGHCGMVGSALVRRLMREDCTILVVARHEVDLRRQLDVERWFARYRPDAVLVAAGTVGGMFANEAKPVPFLYDNLMIAANVIHAAHDSGVEKLLYLGSSCIYPRAADQPMRETDLLTGPFEPTNQWYALAKIAGIQLCTALRQQYGRRFITCLPTNLYGPRDNFDLASCHVLPALIAKAHAAKITGAPTLPVLGSGIARREFLYVDDLADACIHLLQHYDGESPINIGCGRDIGIGQLAELIAEIVGFDGTITFDRTKGDGAPRKLLDVTRLEALGWRPRISLREGIAQTYAWFRDQYVPHTHAKTPPYPEPDAPIDDRVRAWH